MHFFRLFKRFNEKKGKCIIMHYFKFNLLVSQISADITSTIISIIVLMRPWDKAAPLVVP